MTAAEAADCHTGITEAEYQHFVDTALPRKWQEVLATAPERFCSNDPGTPCPSQPQQGDFVSTARGSVLEIVGAPTLARHGTAQPHQRQGNTARLYPLGPTIRVTMEQARAFQQVPVRHRLLPTTGDAEIAALEADPLSPDALKQADAMHIQTEALALQGEALGVDAEQIGYVRSSTVRPGRIMALGSATTGSLTNLAAAQAWEPLRTMDAREPRAHYYQWLRHLRPNIQRLVVNRWIQHTQVEWLPGQARDIYMRRLHSADYMGPQRCKDGWEFCARCRVHLGGLAHCTEAQHEDALHAHELCPAPGGAAEVMRIITRCWEDATGESLQADGPAALFGDRHYKRSQEAAQQYAHLEEPWRALHAATVIALDVARHNSRPPAYVARKLHLKPLDEAQQPTPWSTARIVGRICKEFDKMARRRADRMRLEHRYADFHKTWVVTGLATYVNGQLRTRVLANWRNPSPRVDAQQPILVVATDGSSRGGQAGWGLTSLRTKYAELEASTETGYRREHAAREECGRVVTSPNQPEYIGASRPTNNTGELSAMHHALQGARELAKPGEHVLIISDSQLAICTTTGAWASRKHKLLVANNRRALARLREDGATVHFRHARAHTGHAINERADELALSGAQGMRMRDGRRYAPAAAGVHALPADTVPD